MVSSGISERGLNQHAIKVYNEKLVFDLIATEGPISRRQLSTRVKLTASTLTNIVNALLRLGLVQETGTLMSGSAGGKPRVLLEAATDKYVIGAELASGHALNIGAMALDGSLVSVVRKSVTGSAESLVVSIADQIQAFANEIGRPDQILGVGVGLPGVVDDVSGLWRMSTPYQIEDLAVTRILQDRLECHLVVDRRSRVMLQGECRYGTSTGLQNVCFLLIDLADLAIGAGMLVDGRLIRGHREAAGEVSHMIIDSSGPPCPQYDHRGCLKSLLMESNLHVNLQRGHFSASEIAQVAAHISLAISNLLGAASPEQFVLSIRPEIVELPLIEAIEKSLTPNVFRSDRDVRYVRRSVLGANAGVVGAASALIRRMLDDNSLSLKSWLACVAS